MGQKIWSEESGIQQRSLVGIMVPAILLTISVRCWKVLAGSLSSSAPGLLTGATQEKMSHRMVEVGRKVQDPCFSRDTQNRLPRPTSKCILKICKEESPEPLWAICASSQSPTQRRSASWCSEGPSSVPICAHGLLSTEKSLAPPSQYL